MGRKVFQGELNLQDWKMTDWKMTDEVARVEIDGLEKRTGN